MAPNKKKKKAVSNPARGFATTSLPSKAKPLDDAGKDFADSDAQGRLDGKPGTSLALSDGQNAALKNGDASGRPTDIQEMSPEELEAHLENSELETLVEKHAARCVADAARQVGKLASERRQLRSQAYPLSTYAWLPDETIDELFVMNATDSAAPSTRHANTEPPAEEKCLIDLWTLERVLTSLKLPKVSESIAHIAELALSGRLVTVSDSLPGLFEALQWYASNVQSELPSYEHVGEPGSGPSGDNTPLQGNSEPTSAIHSRQSPALTPATLSEADENSSSSVSSSESDEDNDPAKLTEKYLHISRLIWKAKNPHPIDDAATAKTRQKRISKLNGKIQKLRSDPLFDEYEAESIWNTTLPDLQEEYQYMMREEALKRRGQTSNRTLNTKDLHPQSVGPESDGHNDNDGGGLLGAMFESNLESSSISNGMESQTDLVKLHDFGKWTGISPRRLLDELCKAVDPKSRISLRTLQKTSYSARHGLDISWSVDTMPEDHATECLPAEIVANTTSSAWSVEMQKSAATTSVQSEAYVCTLALFLVSSLGAKEQKAMARLPTVWRDVIKDLTQAKQRLVDDEHKETLRRLRGVVHRSQERLNLEQAECLIKDAQRPSNLTRDRRRMQRPAPVRLTTEQVAEEWDLRTRRPLFQAMLNVRSSLPVHQYKDTILTCIADNAVSVICAETGAGKSSGIPVLLLEQDFSSGRDCRILVTQPRRISAVTLARRVSQELGESRNDIGTARSLVGYAIRLESKTSSTTRITYATTGVLLRMLEESPDLDELDYLILDEVHERTMDLDLLFIALQKLQLRRRTLKIVLMSATVDARKFSAYFGGAPVLDLPGRTFPVEVGFLEDAVEATNDLTGLKDKGLLGQEEVQELDDLHANEKGRPMIVNPSAYSGKTQHTISTMDEYRIDYNLIVKLAASIASKPQYTKYSSAMLIFMPGIGEMRRLHNLLLSIDTFSHGWVIHLLHSTFSTEDLEKAFERPPAGYRKIVIATNIAETGITIPDVTAVIDTCKEKVMRFDERRQLSRLTEGFISRSSARQRRGRAARVQDGLCFHLVTKHRHDNLMLEQQVPEMLRLSLQDPMLRIKVWDLGSIEETLGAAIDPPSRKNVLRAIEKLKDAGALTKTEALTPLGQQIARLPLEVSLAKLAIFGVIFRCLDPILAIISLLTSKSPFLSSSPTAGTQNDARHTFSRGDSDLLSSLNAYEGWRKAKSARSGQEFCRKNHVSDQTMAQVEEQKTQLLVYLVDAGLVLLQGEEKAALTRARSGGGRGGGWGGNTTFHSIADRYNQKTSDRALDAIIAMALYPRIVAREGKGWRNVYTNQQVTLTSRSVNHGHHTAKPPRWLSFYETVQNRSGNLNVFETSAIPESALAALVGEAEFKFFAGVLSLDSGRVRLSVRHWRQLMAVKILRDGVAMVLDGCYKRPGHELGPGEWAWLQLWLNMEALQE